MAGLVNEITDDMFQAEVLNAGGTVIVDFWASWCDPCQAMAPIFEKVASRFEGRVKFCKLNVEDNQMVASQLGIMNIPTLKIFKDGQEVETIIGLQDENSLAAKLNEIAAG